jgi:hypothetical protein
VVAAPGRAVVFQLRALVANVVRPGAVSCTADSPTASAACHLRVTGAAVGLTVPVRRTTSGLPGNVGRVRSAMIVRVSLTDVGPPTRFVCTCTVCRPAASCTVADRAAAAALPAVRPSTRTSKPPISPPGVLTDQDTVTLSRTTPLRPLSPVIFSPESTPAVSVRSAGSSP